MKVTTKIAPLKGIGKPDYSREISRAIERPGISLQYNQILTLNSIVFSPSVDVVTVLVGAHGSGATNLILADATGFRVGGSLVVDPGGVNQEIHRITNIVGNIVTIATGLDNNQAGGTPVIVYSPFPWVVSPLAPGATAHIIDVSTGLYLPTTILAGYTYTVFQRIVSATEDQRIDSYIDTCLVVTGIVGSGNPWTEKNIVGLSTAILDPTAASAHTVDNTVTNLGAGNLEGELNDAVILEAVGTPPLPKAKVIKCKWCDYTTEVPIETDRLDCPKCHQLTLYYVAEKFRRSA